MKHTLKVIYKPVMELKDSLGLDIRELKNPDERYVLISDEKEKNNDFSLVMPEREFKGLPNDYCILVEKSCDFTEGRGSMIIHRLFKSITQAFNYVSQQTGIYGSSQYHYIRAGININGQTYIYNSFNGYDISLMQIEEITNEQRVSSNQTKESFS